MRALTSPSIDSPSLLEEFPTISPACAVLTEHSFREAASCHDDNSNRSLLRHPQRRLYTQSAVLIVFHEEFHYCNFGDRMRLNTTCLKCNFVFSKIPQLAVRRQILLGQIVCQHSFIFID